MQSRFTVPKAFGWLLWLPLVFGLCAAAEGRTVRHLATDLTENGQAINLEMVFFKPAGKGPFPLLVFNHGSTGLGKSSARIKQTFWTNAIAKFFNDRGWLVVFPQRRGRGGSDGLYDEGFGEDRRLGYSCLPERSLPGFDRALEDVSAAIKALSSLPEVDSDNIVIGGVSRGGALAVAYAGQYPEQVKGVLNFVGGWMTNKCLGGPTINQTVFSQGARYKRPMLWLYGKNDPNYSTSHTRWLFEIFKHYGGNGQYAAFDVPAASGHLLYRYEQVWGATLDRYLSSISSEQASLPGQKTAPHSQKVTSPYADVPLPDDLMVTRPESELADERKAFSGVWSGSSKTNWNHVLAVEALDGSGGQAVFALGINKAMGLEQGFWVRLEAVWDTAAFVVLLDGGQKAIYRVRGPDRLELEFYDGKGHQTDHAWLTRVTQ